MIDVRAVICKRNYTALKKNDAKSYLMIQLNDKCWADATAAMHVFTIGHRLAFLSVEIELQNTFLTAGELNTENMPKLQIG